MKLAKGTPAVREKLFGGDGAVSVWNLAPGNTEPFTAVLACELTPGGSVGPHVQQEFPEIVIGVAGDGEALVNREPHALGPGDVVHLPLGSVLALRNRSSERPFSYLIIKARG